MSSGHSDFFVVKYGADGTKKWVKQFGTSSQDGGTGIATDSDDNIYIGGGTYGALDGNTSFGVQDLFIIKYDTNGNKQ